MHISFNFFFLIKIIYKHYTIVLLFIFYKNRCGSRHFFGDESNRICVYGPMGLNRENVSGIFDNFCKFLKPNRKICVDGSARSTLWIFIYMRMNNVLYNIQKVFGIGFTKSNFIVGKIIETRYTMCYICFLIKKNTLFQKRNNYLYLPISV